MSQGRQGVILWSIAGAMLLVAGVFVVVAMRPTAHTTTASDASANEGSAEALQPPSAPYELPSTRPVIADIPSVAPVVAADPRVEGAPTETPPAAAEAPAELPPAPAFAPLVPRVVGALRDVRLAVPIAEILPAGGPATQAVRPSVQEQRLDGMEGIVAGQEAEIRRLETSLAEAERIGNIDDARLRRGRLAELRRVHGGLANQLARMRTEATPTAPAASAERPAP